MKIILPNISASNLKVLALCGSIQNPGREVKKLVSKDSAVNFRFTNGRNRYVLHVETGGSKENHFHVEIRLYSDIKDSPLLKHAKFASRKKIESTFSLFHGCTVINRVTAGMECSINSLPKDGVIRLFSSLRADISDIKLSLDAAKIKVTGAPLKKIEWHMGNTEHPDLASIYLQAIESRIIDDHYLTKTQESLASLFDAFILNKRKAAQ